ncbi:MAG: hypothetical protein V4600_24920 [Pseudomonadota bacterium]|nr:hypothetical protein [Pseudomonas sp. FG1]
MLPSQNIAQWLSSRRPYIWQLLADRQQEVADDNAIRILLEQLHSPEGLPPKADSVCHLINQHLLEHPQLLWPIGWAAENSCGLIGVGSEKVQLDYQSHQLKLELRFVG